MMTVVAPRAIIGNLETLESCWTFLLNAHRSQWTIPVSERDWRTR